MNMTQYAAMHLQLEPVQEQDKEAMADLRVLALRESLERLGRFDEQRARERLYAAFAPQHMRHISCNGQRVGFMTLRPHAQGGLHLDHLYIHPAQQGQGIGAWAIAWVQSHRQIVRLGALKQSDANRFYLRHGFEVAGESEFDIDYIWKPDRA